MLFVVVNSLIVTIISTIIIGSQVTVQQSTQQPMNIKYAAYLYVHDYIIITLHNYNIRNYYISSTFS